MNIHSSFRIAKTSDKRDRILQGALEAFAARGFHGTAVPDIAASAGVAVGTIYRYFPTKDAIGNALLVEWSERLDADVLAAVPPTASPRAVFRLYWRRLAAFAQAHPQAYRFLQAHEDGPARSNRLLSAIRDLANRGRREGVMKTVDPAVVVALLKGALSGLVRQASGEGGRIPADMAEAMEDCLWNAVAARA